MIPEFLIDSLSQGGYFIINKKLLKEFGASKTIILSLFLDKFKYANFQEFFYIGENIENDSGFDIRTIRQALDFWKKAGIILCEKRGLPCKTYYNIDLQKLQKMIKSTYEKTSQNALTREGKNASPSLYKNALTGEGKNASTYIKTESIKTDSIKTDSPCLQNPLDFSDSPQGGENDSELKNESEVLTSKAEKPSKQSKAKEENLAFEQFWGNYPNKINKSTAKTSFQKAIKKGVSPQLIISKAREYANYCRDKNVWTAHASTWLNQERYLNDYQELLKEATSSILIRGSINHGCNEEDDGIF